MKCQLCANVATVHLTDVMNQTPREMHFCESCAREQGVIDGPTAEVQIPGLLGVLFGPKSIREPTPEPVACPVCGIKFSQFRVEGRLGCPHDYANFADQLVPLLAKVHRKTEHRGKIPSRRHAPPESEAADLRELLSKAVAAEDYETAARLRDRLKGVRTSDEP